MERVLHKMLHIILYIIISILGIVSANNIIRRFDVIRKVLEYSGDYSHSRVFFDELFQLTFYVAIPFSALIVLLREGGLL